VLTPIIWLIVTVAALYAVYRLVHRFFPSWGTVITNGLAAVAALFDALGTLPWDVVAGQKEQGMMLMGAAIANMLIRLNGPKAPVGAGA
jgi:hypothetical protein